MISFFYQPFFDLYVSQVIDYIFQKIKIFQIKTISYLDIYNEGLSIKKIKISKS